MKLNSNKRIHLMVDVVKMALVIAISMCLVSLIVFAVSDDPWNAIYNFFIGPFVSTRRIGNIIEAASPLMFTALGVIIIFGAGQFSMISEGAFFIGTCGAMVVAITCPLPAGVHPAVAILLGGVLGCGAALVPALLKMKWNVSELVTSIMLNYVIQFFVIYLITYYFREPESSSLCSVLFEETATMPTLIQGTRIHAGVFLGVFTCIAAWLLLYRTSFGTSLRITGDNALFAKYSGLKVTTIMVAAQGIAGFIAGMGGGAELLGMYNRFKWTATPGYGWTGIVVALLARKNPLMVPLAAAFIAYMNVGADIMARSSDVGREMVDIIQGVMMLLIASDALLQGWKQRMIVKAAKAEEEAQK